MCLIWISVTKQDPTGLSQKTPTHILHLPFVCRKTSAKNKWEKTQKEENSQVRWNNNTLAIKQSQGPLVLPQRSIDNVLSHILWAIFKMLKPSPGGRNSLYASPKQVEPRWIRTEGWGCWLPITSPPANQNNVHELITSSSSNTRLLNTRSRVAHTTLRALALCGSPCLAKQWNFLPTSPQTPSLGFNLKPVHWSRILAALITTHGYKREYLMLQPGEVLAHNRGSGNKNKEMVFTHRREDALESRAPWIKTGMRTQLTWGSVSFSDLTTTPSLSGGLSE